MVYDLLKQNASATQPSFIPRGGGMDMGMQIGGFSGFLDNNMGLMPGGGGAMSGIMNTINSSYGEMDNAMQSAFDTIKQSLSSNYTPQEVLVPNNGGGGMTNTPPGGIGNAQMPPQIGAMRLPQLDISRIDAWDFGQYQGNENDFFGQEPVYRPDWQLAKGGPKIPDFNTGTAQLPGPIAGITNMDIATTGNGIFNPISQQQQIDDMFAGMSGQFNGPQ